MIEVGVVGRDGLIGLPLVLGSGISTNQINVQITGHGLMLGADDLKHELEENAPLRSLLLLYVQAFHAQVAQTAACNGRHTVPERLARWLLIAHDRLDTDEVALTHEVLSLMLGVRRPGVTVAAGTLQQGGLIRFTSGKVTIQNRQGLEGAACECYQTARRHARDILGSAAL